MLGDILRESGAVDYELLKERCERAADEFEEMLDRHPETIAVKKSRHGPDETEWVFEVQFKSLSPPFDDFLLTAPGTPSTITPLETSRKMYWNGFVPHRGSEAKILYTPMNREYIRIMSGFRNEFENEDSIDAEVLASDIRGKSL